MDRREAKDILNGYRLLLHEETDLRHAFDLAIEALGVAENATTTATQKQVAGKLKNPDDSLLTEDSEACKEQKSKLESEDCISRQQAIEALTEWETEPLDEDIVRTLNNLPPVTPTDKDKRIKELEDLFADMLESAQSVPMFTPTVSEDCISRAELLKDFGCSELTRKYGGDHSGYDTYMIYEIQDIIEDAPSVTPTVSEDCISRAEALDEFKKDYDDVFDLMTAIEELPSVTPTERTGEWIVYPLKDEGRVELECPECGYALIRAADRRPHFCENCGARMMGGDTENPLGILHPNFRYEMGGDTE